MMALPEDDGSGSPTSCSVAMDSPSNSYYPSLYRAADATGNSAALEQLPVRIEERLLGLLGEPLNDSDCASVQLQPLRSCKAGEFVAVQDSDGVLRYGQVVDEEDPSSSVKVQVSKVCIRWYAASQIRFFQAVEGSKTSIKAHTGGKELQDGVVAQVNALLVRLNVSLSTSYEEMLAEILWLQHRVVLAEEDQRAALKQVEQAVIEKRDAEKALLCVVCLVNMVDRVLVPCGHSYCATCVERLHRGSCPVCRQEVVDSAAFRIS